MIYLHIYYHQYVVVATVAAAATFSPFPGHVLPHLYHLYMLRVVVMGVRLFSYPMGGFWLWMGNGMI